MGDNMIMDCIEVNKRLQPFLEDLLSEEEYQAFLAHLESCSKCKEYVSAVGSVSNQLWKLGDVKVPSDFSSTVIFKLKQPEQKAQTPKLVVSKKWIVGAIISILTVLAFFFTANYFKFRIQPAQMKDTPVVTTFIEQKPQGERVLELPTGELDELIIREAPTEKAGTLGKGFQKGFLVNEELSKTDDSSDKDKITIPEPPSLHWHFRSSEKTDEAKLLNALSKAGIIPDYQANDLLVFTQTGEKLEELLVQVFLAFQEDSPLSDYTFQMPTLPDKNYRVSVYFEKQNTGIIHWHLSFALPYQKPKLLDMIKKMGGVIDYELKELIVFSMPKSKIDKLKMRILAMRLSLSKFGGTSEKKDQLISGPVKISIYFSR